MITTMRINQVWKEIETTSGQANGLVFRRYSGSIIPDIFCSVRLPEKTKGFGLKIEVAKAPKTASFANLRDLKIENVPDPFDANKVLFLVQLVNQQHTEVFSVLCEDLISRVAEMESVDEVLRILIQRLDKWKSLFESASGQGLTPDQQRGLFGELYFLRAWIENEGDANISLLSWQGPAGNIRDFQIGEWALEVKTTHGNNHQKVQISSERQLDTSNLNYVFLYHLSLEEQLFSGETLNEIVDQVESLLLEKDASLSDFKMRLLQVGYFDQHRHLYDKKGYKIRACDVYHVKDQFPRIEEAELRRGVGDVKYSIVIADCVSYQVTQNELFQTINQKNGRT
jgi:hypothetical protein